MPQLKSQDLHPLRALNVTVTVMRDDGQSEPLYRGVMSGTLGEEAVILSGVPGMPFRVGEGLVVHTNLRGRAIGFVSRVLEVADHPAPHCFLEYPTSFEELELRKSLRIPTLIPVRIDLGNGLQLEREATIGTDGALINLSNTGCAISSHDPIPENEPLHIALSLPGDAQEYQLDITVVSRKEKLDLYVHGARFVTSPEKDAALKALAAWLERQRDYAAPSLFS